MPVNFVYFISRMWTYNNILMNLDSFNSATQNIDIGVNISEDLEQLKSNLDKFKKSGMGGDLDIDIEQMDWVEDNKKVKAFIIYESSV